MKRAVCVHFITTKPDSVLMSYQQYKITGIKGYGGVIENGESALDCAMREIPEETGKVKEKRIRPEIEGGIIFNRKDLIAVALIDFYNGPNVPFGTPSFRVLFYNCPRFEGTVIDTVEMRDAWMYPINNLPFDEMPAGDRLFMEDILQGKMLTGWIRMTTDRKAVISHELKACTIEELVI